MNQEFVIKEPARLRDRILIKVKNGKKTTTTRELYPIEKEFLLYFEKAKASEQKYLLTLLIKSRRDFKAKQVLENENLKHVKTHS